MNAQRTTVHCLGGLLALAAGLIASAGSLASAQADGLAAPAVAPNENQLKRQNLEKMMRQVSEMDFQDTRLEDIMIYLTTVTGAEIEPVWIDDATPEGLDRDALVTLKVRKISALRLLEMVLDKAADDAAAFTGGNTWQMTDWGTIECGPKEVLSKRQRLEIYPIDDLLWEIPDFDEAPRIDLQSVLQSSQGGGGAQSPFQNDNQNQNRDRRARDERAQDIVDIIEALVEPEAWLSGGGTATITYFQGSLLVKAPDYVHRGLGGYPWWPAAQTSVSTVNGRRYVGLGVETGISTIEGFAQQPVTGVVGGGGTGGGGGGPAWIWE